MSRRDVVIWGGALVLGFLLGGVVGWSQRPAEWHADIWHTASASVDAATYGHDYESKAERVLLFFVYGGFGGAACAALIVGVSRKLRAGSAAQGTRGARNIP
jgi:hypothetical protein